MQIDTRTADGVTILDISGRITIAETAEVRKAIADLVEAGRNKILLNLGGVGFMDSSGIGELVRSYHTLRSGGGQVKLLNLTKKIEALLAITKLVTIFECFEDEGEALASFGS